MMDRWFESKKVYLFFKQILIESIVELIFFFNTNINFALEFKFLNFIAKLSFWIASFLLKFYVQKIHLNK